MKSEISRPLVTVHNTRPSKIPPSRGQENNFLLLNQNQAFYPESCTFLTSVLTRVLLHQKRNTNTIEKNRRCHQTKNYHPLSTQLVTDSVKKNKRLIQASIFKLLVKREQD